MIDRVDRLYKLTSRLNASTLLITTYTAMPNVLFSDKAFIQMCRNTWMFFHTGSGTAQRVAVFIPNPAPYGTVPCRIQRGT